MTRLPDTLLAGHRRFKSTGLVRDRALYHSLAERGQAPDAMVIACCDSRAAPETIFGLGPGEIFVFRNIANLVPPYEADNVDCGTAAAVEYAVQSLRVGHIVVLGHQHCGGVKGALDRLPERAPPDSAVAKWVHQIQPALTEVEGGEEWANCDQATTLERASICHSITNLRSYPHIAALEDQGQLELHGVWFNIARGEIWTLRPSSGEFEKET